MFSACLTYVSFTTIWTY